jgi:hypothetical protein
MQSRVLVSAILLSLVAAPAAVLSQSKGAPESFTANLHVTGATGGAGAATIQIDVQRYSPDFDRTSVENALKSGGYPAFLTALRKAPVVGTVSQGDQKWSIRWARERPAKNGRTLVFVTDQPVFFIGGGRVDAKPREGYEVAVIQVNIDDAGIGEGSMAAAARVKPGGDAGVQIDDYADKPIKLTSVVRKIK